MGGINKTNRLLNSTNMKEDKMKSAAITAAETLIHHREAEISKTSNYSLKKVKEPKLKTEFRASLKDSEVARKIINSTTHAKPNAFLQSTQSLISNTMKDLSKYADTQSDE